MDVKPLTITYPSVNPGSARTEIILSPEPVDLVSLYAPGTPAACRRLFVTDSTVAALPCMKPFCARFTGDRCGADQLLILPPGESAKTIENVLTIAKAAVQAGFSRHDCFVGIGGGVITDMTGFAAAIFKRGAPVEFVPTTLLAMVDAAIGGKTGCDFDSYKNMIGSFYPARTITVCPAFIATVSERDYYSGLAEAVKTALLYDAALWELFKSQHTAVAARDEALLTHIILRCAALKAHAVEEDFMETSTRAFLNLGHTFGHALETVSGLGTMPHGHAVAWGIARAARLSAAMGLCTPAYADEVCGVLASYGWETGALPACIRSAEDRERIIAAMHHDKKNVTSTIRIIAQRGITDTCIIAVSDESIRAVLTAE
ncbi:MAG: 3-dehydroquinate synthase [Treponema sp.]|nr:3-dehydroquinate synthase [Treponema sp.]